MNDIKINRLFLTLVFFFLSVILWCCTDDREDLDFSGNGAEKSITFSVRVPDSGASKTYALEENKENEVTTIDILLFDSDGKYTYQPIYSNDIITDTQNSQIKTFSVRIPKGTYDVVFLANSRSSLTSVLNNISKSTSKSDVMNELLLSNNGKWNVDSGSNGYIPIPMWGEISSLTVSSGMSAPGSITLVRMLSRIDVALVGDVVKNKFKLENIRLYNYNDRGLIVPVAENWNGGTSAVTAPSVPASANKPIKPAETPLVYTGKAITNANVSSIGEIYTFEAKAGSSTTLQTNTCLVIGGTYSDDGNNRTSFYRVDFSKSSSGTTEYLPLLRNHHYKVNISTISGPGYDTPEEAFKHQSANIKVEIWPWNDAQMSDVIDNGEHILGVSQGKFLFSRWERTALSGDNILSVTTDYPGGWKVEKIVDVENAPIGWLTLSAASGVSGKTTAIRILLGENNTGVTRVGYIHLSAGRLVYAVEVSQNSDGTSSLMIKDAAGITDIDELLFYAPVGVQPDAQQFQLNWLSAAATVSANAVKIGGVGFNYDTSSSYDQPGTSLTSISDPSGNKLLTIRPTAITKEEADKNGSPFGERISRVDFMVSHGGSYVSKSLFLRQFTYAVIADNEAYYIFDGSTYSFHVRSNCTWEIANVKETLTSGSGSLFNLQPGDNLHKGTTGGNNISTGDLLTFRTAKTKARGTVAVTFHSPDNKFADKTILFEVNPILWAGSNIYYDEKTGHLTFADVKDNSKASYQGVFFMWGSLYGISSAGSYDGETILYPPGGGVTSGMEWDVIPHITTDVSDNRNQNYLYDMTNGTSGVGDICKWLTTKGYAPGSSAGKKWRMPTSKEFEATYNKIDGTYNWVELESDNPYGLYPITSGYTMSAIGTPFFPVSGARVFYNGELLSVGTSGAYWSASPENSNAYPLILESSGATFDVGAILRKNALSVRCVLE